MWVPPAPSPDIPFLLWAIVLPEFRPQEMRACNPLSLCLGRFRTTGCFCVAVCWRGNPSFSGRGGDLAHQALGVDPSWQTFAVGITQANVKKWNSLSRSVCCSVCSACNFQTPPRTCESKNYKGIQNQRRNSTTQQNATYIQN